MAAHIDEPAFGRIDFHHEMNAREVLVLGQELIETVRVLAGIAVGVGLIALGTVLKNIPKFATGGVVTKPTLIMAGEQGPERITPLGYEGSANNMWGSGEVVFQISGQNLRGILRRADQTAFNTF